jgi:hypothetical protein
VACDGFPEFQWDGMNHESMIMNHAFSILHQRHSHVHRHARTYVNVHGRQVADAAPQAHASTRVRLVPRHEKRTALPVNTNVRERAHKKRQA